MWGGCQWIQKKEQRNMQTLQLKTETKHYVKNDGDGVALSHWASGQKRGMQGSGWSCPRVCCATNPSYLYSSGLRVLWSVARHINLSLGRALLKLICLIQVCTVWSTYLYLLCIRTYSLEVCTVCSVYSPGMQSILARYAGVKSASSLVLHRGAINT